MKLLEWTGEPHEEKIAMQAIEFSGKAHDGVIDLPAGLESWNGRAVKVILLADEAPGEAGMAAPSFSAAKLKTRGFSFDREEANAR